MYKKQFQEFSKFHSKEGGSKTYFSHVFLHFNENRGSLLLNYSCNYSFFIEVLQMWISEKKILEFLVSNFVEGKW